MTVGIPKTRHRIIEQLKSDKLRLYIKEHAPKNSTVMLSAVANEKVLITFNGYLPCLLILGQDTTQQPTVIYSQRAKIPAKIRKAFELFLKKELQFTHAPQVLEVLSINIRTLEFA